MMTVALVGLSAQAKPNFAGKWTLQADPNAPAAPAGGAGGGRGGGGRGGGGFGGGGQFCGMECNIAQDATTLTITRTTQAGEMKTEYKLDGTETTATQQAGQGTMTIKNKAAWTGSTLTITTTTDFNGTPTTAKTEISLDSMGMLKVARTAAPRGGGDAVTTTQMYKKG
jgi:hypothetical protein